METHATRLLLVVVVVVEMVTMEEEDNGFSVSYKPGDNIIIILLFY